MRTFYFKARIVGQEKYLTYTMGEDCELDEDVLDYCEENKPAELVDIIYEEDDDYDYLTYDITDRVSLEDFIKQEAKCENVLYLLRNIANSLISLKEQKIPLNYILLNRNFIYIDESFNVFFLCVPVESKGSLVQEFKGFVREILANMVYDVDEDLNYVGKVLTYINGASFNLRGLIGLSEALMEEEGINFEEMGGTISDGVEVISGEEEIQDSPKKQSEVADFMNSSAGDGEPLPEIGDDEEDEEAEDETIDDDQEIESIVPKGIKIEEPEPQEEKPQDKEAPIPKVETEEAVPAPVQEAETEESAPAPVQEAETEESAPALVPEAETPQPETGDSHQAAPAKKTMEKETDVDIIKNRIQNIVSAENDGKIDSIEALDTILNKPPTVKKNVVKVNRAALIQSAADHDEENGTPTVSVENGSKDGAGNIEEIASDMNVENKPASSSILNKKVEAATTTQTTFIKINPYLIRVNTDEKIVITKPIFKLGKSARGIDYTVSGNGAISRQHATIIQKDGVCYIRDNKSTNHTYVNDRMVEDGVDEILTHDSMIRLGDEEFRFKLR